MVVTKKSQYQRITSQEKKRLWILFPPFLMESPSVSTTYYVKRRRTDARHNCLFDWLSGVTWRIMQYVTIQPFSIRRESLIQIWVSSEPTSITSPPRFLIKCPSSLCYLFLRTNGVTLSHYPIGMTTSFANPDSWPHFRHCFSVDADAAAIYLWLRRSCSLLSDERSSSYPFLLPYFANVHSLEKVNLLLGRCDPVLLPFHFHCYNKSSPSR